MARGPTGDSRILAGVPAPGTLPAGRCALVRATMAALAHAGRPVDYDVLMGLSAVAFMLPLEPDFQSVPADARRCARLPAALAALGLRGRAWPLAGAETMAPVYAALDAGFAVPLLGWPQPQDDWGVLTGYDHGRGVVCGWPAGYAGESYVGAAPAGTAAILLEQVAPVPELAPELAATLEWVVAHAADVAAAYPLWCDMLDERWERDEDELVAAARVLRHEVAAEALADARAAAASFLRWCGDRLLGVAAEWALSAAERCDALVESLEARHPPLFDDEVAEALRSATWRGQWRRRLAGLAEADADVARDLRRALTTDLAPGDIRELS